ncbi:unnamed protein product [Chondrus crispus]|uniref:Uncharacterized protein n=1 Tax=Chondrus crispus TaxID=2769 RepID=R7Q417_CHOCR|nr:unnamed protein product [Chondrus crispus]CDF32220.1 unnamed protein product [Chondrus crispus]|eukprot:XP_005711885.1 unnamed protein product [Chondrus crispus]
MTTLKSRSAATHLPNQPGDKPASTRSVSDPTPPTTAMAPPEPSSADAPNWWRDRHSVLLLISLYTAQGLPMGLAFGSIPFLLKERGSSYAHLAAFSFASLPYSLKLLIAPIVDSCYSPSFGRRKSWIVPVQLVAGLTMTLLADTIRRAVAEGNVALLTPVFLTLLAMCATQDIAVDGWSLTMLQKQNVSYASTCQSLGLTIGYFSTFTLFLAFSNAPFCDNYIRPLIFFSNQTGPVADLASVLRTAGLYYLLLTLYIALFKKELPPTHSAKKTDAELEDPHFDQEHFDHPRKTRSAVLDSITSTYSDLLIVVRKPAVRSLVSMLLISKLGFSAYDNGTFSCCTFVFRYITTSCLQRGVVI